MSESSSNGSPRIVVVGASLAGMQAAQTLRRAGFGGELTIVGDETHYPYDRPPLSKQFLAGDWEESKLTLRGAVDPEEHGFTWKLGCRAIGLDLDRQEVAVVGSEERLHYDGLIIATGASPRRLPGCELGGVHVLRTLDDARGLLSDLGSGPKNVCIIGAGFIGAEVAATARQMGHEVSLVEAAPAPLARVLDRGAGLAIADLHRSHGVKVFLGSGVDQIEGDGVTVQRVALSDGTTIESDVVVVGIGVVPATDWLSDSGLTIDNGIVCDQTCMAAPGVMVAGDVARWPNQRYDGALMRVEQWDNAVEQGGYVGRSLLAWFEGESVEPYAPIPWFWSDQYDRKIQLAGVTGPVAEVVHGTIKEQRFVQIYANEAGDFLGAMAWNRPRHAIKARQLLSRSGTLDEARQELA